MKKFNNYEERKEKLDEKNLTIMEKYSNMKYFLLSASVNRLSIFDIVFEPPEDSIIIIS